MGLLTRGQFLVADDTEIVNDDGRELVLALLDDLGNLRDAHVRARLDNLGLPVEVPCTC